jgi:hypothetical protein
MLSGLRTRRFFFGREVRQSGFRESNRRGKAQWVGHVRVADSSRAEAAELGLPAIGCPSADEASRHGRELLAAVQPFAREFRVESWWCLGSTLTILALLLGLAAVLPWWPLRLAASVLGGLVLVRTFILYHDFMHGAILRESRLAKLLLGASGC